MDGYDPCLRYELALTTLGGMMNRRLNWPVSVFLVLLLAFILPLSGLQVGDAVAVANEPASDLPLRTASRAPLVERVAGDDRLATAVEVSRHGWESADTVVIATSRNFPDALVGGPLAASYSAPILPADASGLSEGVLDEIARLGATRAFIVGGTSVVPSVVEGQLAAAGFSLGAITRLAGADRYETAVLVADHLAGRPGYSGRIVVATGQAFPDAVAVSGFAGFAGMPVLLVAADRVPPSVQRFLGQHAPAETLVVGGVSAVSDKVMDRFPVPERVGGPDRYATSTLIAEYAFQRGFDYEELFIATGLEFSDALVAGSLCAARRSPIVLVRPDSLPAATKSFIDRHCSAILKIIVLGGEGAIDPTVVSAARLAATEVVNADAQEVAPATESLLETMTADGDLVFSASNAQLAALVPGAVLVSTPSSTGVVPEGYFRKVIAVTDSGGEVTVETTQAALTDVIVKGSIDITGTADEVPPVLPPAVEVAAGDSHTLALLVDGTLWAWGANDVGQLGSGTASADPSTRPQRVGQESDWLSIAAGPGLSFGIKQDGTLWAWGSNASGRLGLDASIVSVAEPTLVSAESWTHVVGYSQQGAGIRSDGTLWTWGSDVFGQRGDGPAIPGPAMSQVGTDTDWEFVDIGNTHSLALKDDGTLWAWGTSQFGQTGIGTTTRYSPVQVGTGTWKSVTAAHWHSAGVMDDGTLWAWGNNNQGTVGDGTTNHRSLPVKISADDDWSAVSSRGSANQALRDDRTRWTWGDGGGGGYQLCLDSPGDRLVPTGAPEDFAWFDMVSAGGIGITGIDMRGEVWTAGTNTSGQLGDGTKDSRLGVARIDPDEETVAAAYQSAALTLPGGGIAPAARLGSWWEGFEVRYYPDLNDWTFASWADQNPGTYYGDYFAIDGHVSLYVTYNFNINIQDSTLQSMGFYMAMDEGLSLWVDTTRVGWWEGSLGMWPIPKMTLGTVPFAAGPLPGWVDINLQVLCGLDGLVYVPAFGFQQYADRTIGFEWDRYGGFREINYGDNTSHCYAPHPNGAMSAKAWTSAELSAMFYSVAGPYVKFTGFGELDARTDWDPWWKLELGLDGEVGVKMDLFGAIDESWSTSSELIRWTVARGSGPYPY
jgi:alpha-tubulin suppressor-like RCC1 family protein/putative cell wall-binding protein